MGRVRLFASVILLLLLAAAGFAEARQGGPLDAAGEAIPMATASAAASASAAPPEGRPVRGPALRERAGRRSRGASTASGVLMLTILIGAMGYYVLKRIRR